MLDLVVLILDVMEKCPDNEIAPLVREICGILRGMPQWERKEEWKHLKKALRNRFHDKTTTQELLQTMREHIVDLEDLLR